MPFWHNVARLCFNGIINICVQFLLCEDWNCKCIRLFTDNWKSKVGVIKEDPPRLLLHCFNPLTTCCCSWLAGVLWCGCLPNIITKTGGESHKYRTKLFSLCCYASLAVHILRSIRSGSKQWNYDAPVAGGLPPLLYLLFFKWAKIRGQMQFRERRRLVLMMGAL